MQQPRQPPDPFAGLTDEELAELAERVLPPDELCEQILTKEEHDHDQTGQ